MGTVNNIEITNKVWTKAIKFYPRLPWHRWLSSLFHESVHPSVHPKWHYHSDSFRILNISLKCGGTMHITMKHIPIENGLDWLILASFTEIQNFSWYAWALPHEAVHYSKWLWLADVCILRSWPAEGAIFLWPSWLGIYLVFFWKISCPTQAGKMVKFLFSQVTQLLASLVSCILYSSCTETCVGGQNKSKSLLVQVMAWCQASNKPSPDPMLALIYDTIWRH